MSIRLRIFSSSLTAILALTAVGMAAGFFLFWVTAAPYLGKLLGENALYIAARYFPAAGVVALILTGIGTFWVVSMNVQHVIGPLQRLKRAAGEIRDGNLDYELVVSGQDELSELAADFEQMRVRLKDSMWKQENAESERRALIATVSHDLQTPITSIIGYAEGILDGVADTPEKLCAYAAVIRKKARSLGALAQDLSLLSRLENAQLPLDKRQEDLGAWISDLASEFAQGEPTLRLTTDLAPGLLVWIDREKMARVVLNLLQNSVKYKKPDSPGAEVSMILTAQSGQALLTISDNGMGAAPDDLPHLFERFYRADTSRSKQPGAGLGLSIARQLVTLHEGKIWITSNTTGGLSVNISLPLARKKQ